MDNGIDRETLRAELGQLELRLVDRLAGALESKADSKLVEQHDARIASLELSRAARENLPIEIGEHEKRIGRLERWRYAWPSTAVIGVVVSIGMLLYYTLH